MPPPKHTHRRFYKPLPKDFVGTLCSSCAYSASQPHPEEKCIASMPAKIANARKDLDYYNTMAIDASASRGIASSVLATLDAVVGAGSGEAMVPQLADLLAG